MSNKLSASGREILNNVKKAMQDAEEIWGVEGDEYMDLMRAIIDEANRRQVDYFHMIYSDSRGSLRGFLR